MKALAAEFGVTRTTIGRCLDQLGVPRRLRGLQPQDVAEAARLYEQGWSLVRLADKFGCDHEDVRNKLAAAGVVMRPRPGWHHQPCGTNQTRTTSR